MGITKAWDAVVKNELPGVTSAPGWMADMQCFLNIPKDDTLHMYLTNSHPYLRGYKRLEHEIAYFAQFGVHAGFLNEQNAEWPVFKDVTPHQIPGGKIISVLRIDFDLKNPEQVERIKSLIQYYNPEDQVVFREFLAKQLPEYFGSEQAQPQMAEALTV